jgi:hypothetical protein
MHSHDYDHDHDGALGGISRTGESPLVFWVSCIPYGTMDGSMGYLDTGALELGRLDTRNHTFCSPFFRQLRMVCHKLCPFEPICLVTTWS